MSAEEREQAIVDELLRVNAELQELARKLNSGVAVLREHVTEAHRTMDKAHAAVARAKDQLVSASNDA
jgi:hypothetical protein